MHVCVCMCVCVHLCVHVCVHVCVACVRACLRVWGACGACAVLGRGICRGGCEDEDVGISVFCWV